MDSVLGPETGFNFSAYIAEHTQHFTGREWIVTEIERWRAASEAPRTFLLTGDPGIGKTAFAAYLVQSRPEWLTAWHFCSATRGGWIDPIAFARSLAGQISTRYPSFMEALLRHVGIEIDAHMTIGTLVGGQAVNVLIERLEMSGIEDAFNRLVRRPLQDLEPQGSPLILLVDGLDEALAYGGPVSIADVLSRAGDLPRFVRLLLTSRNERRVLQLWDRVPHFRLHAEGERNMADVRLYVERRLANLLGEDGPALRDRVVSRSSGNFLYISYLVETLSRHPESLDDLEDLPEGLDGVYRAFLNHRDIGKDPTRWETRYLPVLGVLAVAREPLSEQRICQWTNRPLQMVAGALRDLWQYLSVESGEELRFRIYHRSFLDFLLDRSRSRDYWIDGREWHCRIADYYLGTDSPLDAYAMQHLVPHLAGAGRHETLFALVDDRSWLDRKMEVDPSGGAYLTDVETALGTALRQGVEGLPVLIGYALLYSAFTGLRAQSLPRILAERVGRGEVAQAFEIAAQIANPVRAAAAYKSLAQLLAAKGDRERAISAWRQARAAVAAIANPVTATRVLTTLAGSLLTAGESEKGDEVLQQAQSIAERIPDVKVRIELWAGLAVLAEAAEHAGRAEVLFLRAIADLDTIKLEIPQPGDYDASDESVYHYDSEVDVIGTALETLQAALMRCGNPDLCSRLFERLQQVAQRTEGRLAELAAEYPKNARFRGVEVQRLRSWLQQARQPAVVRHREGGEILAAAAETSFFSFQERSGWISPFWHGRSYSLRPERVVPQPWSLAAVRREAPVGCQELDLIARSDFDGALRLIAEQSNNQIRADLLMVLARQISETIAPVPGAEILETVLCSTNGMWAREEIARVQAGAALGFLRLGHAKRALEVASGIEYNDLQVEALAAMLREWRAEGDRRNMLLHADEFERALAGLWAEVERVRGWIALAAAVVWAGNQSRAAELLERAAALAARIPSLERGYRPARFITPGLARYPEWSPSWLEEGLADLVRGGHGGIAVQLVARLAPILDIERSLRYMGTAALATDDAHAYGKLLSLASELDIGYMTLLGSPPDGTDLVAWLGTAFQAARFHDTTIVKKHFIDGERLLRRIAQDLPERVYQRLLQVETLLAVEGYSGTARGEPHWLQDMFDRVAVAARQAKKLLE